MDKRHKPYAKLSTSHLLGPVLAVIGEEKNGSSYEAPRENSPLFPPNNVIGRAQGYQTLGSLSAINGDFFCKINGNPDLYGLIWIATMMVFVIASLGNCATYLMDKRSDASTSWSFDVSYVDVAACSIYGYVVVVPLGFYFLLQYLGSKPSLVCFWCIWGYSLFIFVLSSFLLVIPVEFVRWTIIIITGAASASFVALNLRSSIQGNDLTLVLVAAFVLQMGLALFIKMWFFV